MRKTTVIYARYSSHAQDGGTSIEVQLDACRRGRPDPVGSVGVVGELGRGPGQAPALLLQLPFRACMPRRSALCFQYQVGAQGDTLPGAGAHAFQRIRKKGRVMAVNPP